MGGATARTLSDAKREELSTLALKARATARNVTMIQNSPALREAELSAAREADDAALMALLDAIRSA